MVLVGGLKSSAVTHTPQLTHLNFNDIGERLKVFGEQ